MRSRTLTGSRRPCLATLVLLLFLGQTGCASWRELSPDALARRSSNGNLVTARVVTPDSTLTLRNARMEGDSLQGEAVSGKRPRHVKTALPPGAKLEVLGPDRGKTRVFAFGTILLVSAFLIGVHNSHEVR